MACDSSCEGAETLGVDIVVNVLPPVVSLNFSLTQLINHKNRYEYVILANASHLSSAMVTFCGLLIGLPFTTITFVNIASDTLSTSSPNNSHAFCKLASEFSVIFAVSP